MIKKIFITGAGGFVGSELVNGFSKLKYEVYALDKHFNYPIFENSKIIFYKKNLNKLNLSLKLKYVDYFIHTAAVTNPRKNLTKNSLISNNLSLTKKALYLAKKLKVKKFYFFSSTGVYRSDNSNFFDEKSKIYSLNEYAKSKILGEEIVRKFCIKNDLDYKILRLGNIYSGFEKKLWSRKNVSIFQKWLNNAYKDLILKTNSFKTKRDWTYVKDIPLVINRIINSRNTKNVKLNLVSPYIREDIEMMRIISKKINKKNNFKEKLLFRVKHNASSSLYIKNFKFNKWTSPEKAINQIYKINNEKN